MSLFKKLARITTNPILNYWAKHDSNYLASFIVQNDENYLHKDTPISRIFNHSNQWEKLFEIANKDGLRVLEIGSREVTGKRKEFVRKNLSKATYVGFDYYPGDNVDVVGDVHKLSSYFKENEKFDVIFTSACFEHFAMPWIAAIEIAKMLKIDGYLMIETHFSFSSHERPWHFFHYTDMALKVLFSKALGFECIEAGMSNPIIGRFSSLADEYLRNKPISGLYCHVEYFGRKIKNINNFDWEKVDLVDVVGETKYPEPK
ncbi:MAG: class I SAM-dependent methyltransferase [Chitinophagaceae bacterium]|nr:class I SAM-dependent methyltransferase [Chitinophagaceae bacterium]